MAVGEKVQSAWLAELPSTLTTLSLEHCGLTSIDPLTRLCRLEEISLMHNQLKSAQSSLSKLPRLKKVWLVGNPIPAEELGALRRQVDLKY